MRKHVRVVSWNILYILKIVIAGIKYENHVLLREYVNIYNLKHNKILNRHG